MASDLVLCVLGPLRLLRDGAEIEVSGARQREVLARLSVAAGKPVSAEALLEDVWGPVAGEPAAASLHVSISKLRRAMDPGRRARADSPLLSTSGGYALAIGVDVTAVEEQARRASTMLAAGELESAHDELARARASWRGEAYEGLGAQPWLLHERRHCEELRLYLSELYAETSLRLGRDAAGVVVDLTSLAQQHPGHERLAVLLAVALYRQQRQDDALGVLRATREHLREESGLDPGPELMTTEDLILAQEPDPYAPRHAAAVSATPVDPVDSLPGSYRMVGRGRARAVLDAAAQAAESGRGTTCVLVGDAGIGKTRLARATADDLAGRGWRLVWTHGSEDDGAPALWPWASVVRRLGRDVILAPELAALLEVGEQTAGTDRALARWRQTEEMVELLESVASQAPLMVVFDDLHWADAASQSLLVELTERAMQAPVLLVTTSRPASTPGLTATLARLARLGAVRLELEGLTEADIQALAAAAGLEVDPAALRERTGGNPFLLQETLAYAAESGAPPLEVIPASVVDVLGARMARLPSPGEDVLLVASVLGSEIDPADVAHLAELDLPAVEDGLDAALAAGLLRAEDGGAIRFRHDLVREIAHGRLGAVRRSRLHGQALHRLTQSRHLNPALLATHARAAGPSHADQAVQWSAAAATEATARHAPDSALHWWLIAQQADRSATVPDGHRRVKVLLGLVRAQLDAGDAVGAIETRDAAVEEAAQLGDDRLVVAALSSLDGPMVWLPRPMGRVNTSMIGHLERALTATPPPSPAERCMLLATLAIELYAPAQAARCDQLTAEALDLAETLNDPVKIGFALTARVSATAFPGREAERAQVADRMVELGQEAGLSSIELAGHQFACRLRLQLFEVRTADAHAREARRMSEQLRLPLPAMQQRLWDCSRRALDGDLRDAQRMLDAVEELDWPWWGREAMFATVRLTLLLRAGAFDQAAPLLDLAAQVNPQMAADAAVLVAHANATQPPTMPVLGPGPRDWAWLSSGCVRAQAAIALGDLAAMESAYQWLLPGSGMIASTGSFDAGPVDAYLADLAAAMRRHQDAQGHRARLAGLLAREGLAG
jgi:DNA-binding SARP family transcriptional activator